MSTEVFRLGASTPPNSFAHANAYLQASAGASFSARRGIDITAGFDLQGQVNAQAGGSGMGASFAAGVDVSGAFAVQAALPIDLFSSEGAGLVARLQAKLALTAFVSAALTLDRSALEQTVRADFSGPMSTLLDIVLDELDVSAGFWGRASLAIQALGEAVLAGTLLPSADGGAGLSFSARYETAFIYGAGTHFIANLGFDHPQRLFTRLTGAISAELLALVTPPDPDDEALVAVGLGALRTLLPVAVRGLFQLGMALADNATAATALPAGPAGPAQPAGQASPAVVPADASTAVSALAASLIAQGQQVVVQAVSDLATSLLSGALADARLVAALSRLTASDLTTITGQLTAVQSDVQALTGTDITDIDQWITGLLTCLSDLDTVLTSLAGFGVPAAVTGDTQSWAALLWAAGTLLQRIISWADGSGSGSPFSADPVTPTPVASIAAAVKPAGGTIAYADVVTYLIGSQVTSTDLETALRNAIPQAGAVFDWLNTALGSSQGQLLQTLFQDLAAPSAEQAATLISQLGTAAADALTNHILPELLDPLAAAQTDPAVAAFVEDVVKPALTALPQSILPALAGLGATPGMPGVASALDASDPALRLREAISAVLLQIVEHLLATTLKVLIDHALTNAQAALNTAADDVSAGGPVTRAVQDIDALAAVLLADSPETILLIPTAGDIVNLLTLAGVVAYHLEQASDDLFGLVDTLMQFALGSDATRQASLTALTSSDQPVDQPDLSQALSKVGDGALKVVGDVLDDLPTLIADHVANEVAAIVAVVEQVAGQIVTALSDAISALEQAGQTAANYLNNVLLPQVQKLLGDLGSTITQFGEQIQGLAQQALDQIQQAGLNVIEDLMGGPPVSWVQQAIVDLYNALFGAIADIVGFVTGILAAGAEAVGEVLTAIASGGHGTQADADAALHQGLLAASSADLNFDLKVSVAGVTLLDLGTVTISAGTIGGILHDQINGDEPSQTLLSTGAEQAATAAQANAKVAAAQTQQAANTSQTTALQAQVASFTLPATPTVAIVTPTPGTTVPFGARVLISADGVNAGFAGTTLGAAPRIVVTVNGVRWTYQPTDWVTDAIDPGKLILQADLVAFPLTSGIGAAGAGGTDPLAPQSVTTTPAVSATFDARTATLVLQPTTSSPPGRQPLPPQPLPMTDQPWTRRALLRQALADPAGTVTAGLTGAGQFTVTNIGTGQRTPVPAPQPWTLNPPSPDLTMSRSVPVMAGKLGLNTISVAVADGAGHTATATTTVVIEPGLLYAISAKHSGSCLTVAGGETASAAGASVQQSAWAGGRNQMWQLVTATPPRADGAVDLTAAHSGLALGLSTDVPVGAYDGWYGCAKCGALFAAGGPASGTACPGGGSHDPGTSADFFLGNYVLVAGWAQCLKCAGLFTDVAGLPSVCPAGGTHFEGFANETSWTLAVNVTAGADMPSWQECGKCGVLVAADGTGTCAAGGGHNPAGAATVVPSLDMDGTPLAQGNPGGPWRVLPGADPQYRQLQRQRSDGSTLVAEVAGASLADGATVDQATSTGADSQQWRLTPVPAIDPAAYYTVTNASSGLVLEVQGGPAAVADGTAIDQAAASGQANQHWRFLPNSDGSYAMVAEHSGSCLSEPSDQYRYDTGPVIQSHPSSVVTAGIGFGPPQSWQLIPASPGYYRIQSAATGLVLAVDSTAAGALVQQGDWRALTSQEWSLSMVTDLDTGTWYTITARHSGLVLGVAGGPAATQPGTAVEQEVPANMMSQRWRLLPGAAAGYYVLLAQHTTLSPGSGGCLDLAGGATASGTAVVLNTQAGAASQSWQLVQVEPGVCMIQDLSTGQVLQAGGDPAALAPGLAAQAAAWTGADNQKWWLTR
jgi:hypothetical protein